MIKVRQKARQQISTIVLMRKIMGLRQQISLRRIKDHLTMISLWRKWKKKTYMQMNRKIRYREGEQGGVMT